MKNDGPSARKTIGSFEPWSDSFRNISAPIVVEKLTNSLGNPHALGQSCLLKLLSSIEGEYRREKVLSGFVDITDFC
jgi:hypothetical protein